MNILAKLLIGVLAYEGTIQAGEHLERHNYYRIARQYCDEVGKPLLRIGMRRSPFEPPNGDVTIDLDPAVERIPGGVCGDVRALPFNDKTFGVTFNEHVLEHLHEPEDVEAAIEECVRVADYAILLAPSPYSIYATFFCPTHHLRLWFDKTNNRIIARPNIWRTGFGYTVGPIRGIAQSMVVEELHMPLVISKE